MDERKFQLSIEVDPEKARVLEEAIDDFRDKANKMEDSIATMRRAMTDMRHAFLVVPKED